MDCHRIGSFDGLCIESSATLVMGRAFSNVGATPVAAEEFGSLLVECRLGQQRKAVSAAGL
jgi:hypothetical protein